MADLILCIDFVESRKQGNLLLETYVGKVKKLKSRQYSGPLKKTDIRELHEVDNLSRDEFERIKKELSFSRQISNYQFNLSRDTLCEWNKKKIDCLYYHEDKKRYEIDALQIFFDDTRDYRNSKIKNVLYFAQKTHVDIYVPTTDRDNNALAVQAEFYINLQKNKYTGRVSFLYGTIRVDYGESAGMKEFRDYKYEADTVKFLHENGWRYQKHIGFFYTGRDVYQSLKNIEDQKIRIYTMKNQRISVGRIQDASVSYHMDWFDLKGNIQVDDVKYSLQELRLLYKTEDQWIKLGNKNIILPQFHGDVSAWRFTNKGVRIAKDDFEEALLAANFLSIDKIRDLDKFVDYAQVQLNLPEDVFDRLKDYQKIGVQWMLCLYENGFGGCLADDMGLGKTLQVIAYLSDARFKKSHALIIMPKTLLDNWRREIEMFNPRLRIVVYHEGRRNVNSLEDADIILTTYGVVVHDIALLKMIEFSNIVIDEAQQIKNKNSKAYQAIFMLSAHTKIALTGTPVENHIKEYYFLMKLLNPKIFKMNERDKKFQDAEGMIAFIKPLASPFILRRLKTEVLKELPSKKKQTVYCIMGDSQRGLYEEILGKIRAELKRKPERYEMKSNQIYFKALSYLQKVCCHPLLLPNPLNPGGCYESVKLNELMKMIEYKYREDHKIVVFSRFVKMLKFVEQDIRRTAMRYFVLTGETTKRMQVINEFERSPKGVFLMSLKAGGYGVNLTSADTVILYEPWWNPAVEQQAEDRVYRIGQKKDVEIYRLVAKETLEEEIEKLQNKKQKISDALLEGEDEIKPPNVYDLRKIILEG